jgi:hypothetical protein
MSAAQFIPSTNAPEDVRRAFERAALWIERQGDTNKTHWGKIGELERDCSECRNDRRQIDELVTRRLAHIDETMTEIRVSQKWILWLGRIAFGLASLYVAAHAAGVLK